MNPPNSGPTPLNPRGQGGGSEAGKREGEQPTGFQGRSESSISTEAQAVRTLASAHRLAGEIENEARRRADEITAQAELRASEADRDARARAQAMIADAQAERDRIWEEIRIGVGRATRQIGELLRIREELRLDLHEAMRASRDAIGRLEEAPPEAPPETPMPAWLPGEPRRISAPPAAPAPARTPAPPISGRASELPGATSPLSPRGEGAPAPPTPASPAQPAAPRPQPVADEALSSLRVGPFESFLEVMRFERDLAGLAEIDAVYVRRFSNGEVDVEVDAEVGNDALVAALREMPGVEAVQPVGGVLRVQMGGGEAPPPEE